MRQHMAGILLGEGFVQCPEQQRLAQLLRETVAEYGSQDADTDYPMLRAVLMGAVYAALVPGVPMPVPRLAGRAVQALPPRLGDGCPAGHRGARRDVRERSVTVLHDRPTTGPAVARRSAV